MAAAKKEQKVGLAILEEIRKQKLITAHCATCQQPVALIHSMDCAEVVGSIAIKAAKARAKKDKAAEKSKPKDKEPKGDPPKGEKKGAKDKKE